MLIGFVLQTKTLNPLFGKDLRLGVCTTGWRMGPLEVAREAFIARVGHAPCSFVWGTHLIGRDGHTTASNESLFPHLKYF